MNDLTILFSGAGYSARAEMKANNLRRSIEIISGSNAGTTMSGTRIFDVIGTRTSYSIDIYPDPDALGNALFIEKLNAGEVENISLYAQFPRNPIRIFAVGDAITELSETVFRGVSRGTNKWGVRTLTITPKSPQVIKSNDVVYSNGIYDDSDIYVLSQDRETSLDNSSLGLDTASIEVKSAARLDSGYHLFDRIDISRGGNADGLYFLKGINRTAANRYKLNGISSVGRLQNVTHLGGIYSGETAQTVIEEICDDIPVVVDADYATMPIYGYLPATSDARDNLAQVLFAIGAALKTESDGTLHVTSLSNVQSGSFSADDIYAGATVETDEAITDVIVYEHTYSPGTAELILFDGTASGNQLIIFDEPAHGLVATGFSIISSGANYAVLSAGTGTLTGYNFDHSTRTVRGSVIPSASAKNEKTISKATLVSSYNINQVVSRLMTYYACREHIIFDAPTTDETSGDVIAVAHPFDGNSVIGTIEKLSISSSAVRRGSFRLLSGFVPSGSPETFDNEDIRTGSGSWTVPNDVHRISVTLLSGGSGGSIGENGTDAENPPITESTSTKTVGVRRSDIQNLGNAPGGKGGAGGAGAKVFAFLLDVTPGDVFAFSCGLGGAGQTALTPAQSGTPTTFGSFSSESGTSYPNPIYTMHGIAYGGNGDEGVDGGFGGGYRDGSSDPVIAPDIIVGGISYHAGVQGADLDTSHNYGDFETYSKGSLGGGPAYKANGNDGDQSDEVWDSSPPHPSLTLNIHQGGNGADAVAPDPETTPGKGGRGGNGGGGAGQIGWQNYLYTKDEHYSWVHVNLPTPARGGAGSSGSKGGDGIIIIQY